MKEYSNYAKIILIYKQFTKKPNKVFLRRDFGGYDVDIKLNLLRRLGLIEVVPAMYKVGNRNCASRNVKGYKLLVNTSNFSKEKTK